MTDGSKTIILRATHLLTQSDIRPDVQWLNLWSQFQNWSQASVPDLDGVLLLALQLLGLGLLPLLLPRVPVVGPRVPRPVPVPPTLPARTLCSVVKVLKLYS